MIDLIKRLTETLGLLTVLGGVGYGVAGDAVVPASKLYVQQKTERIKDVQIEQAEGKLEAAKRSLKRLELDYLKAATDQERVENKQAQRDEQETIDKLKDQLRTLR